MTKDEYDEWKGTTGAGYRLREMVLEMNKRYKIVRFFRHSTQRKVIKTGLTLEQAKEHCSDASTSSGDWFDGYESDDKSQERRV